MPRAVSNRHAKAAGPYERTSSVLQPGRGGSDEIKSERQDAGFVRALSRRISQVFSLSAGRPSDVPSDPAPEVSQDSRAVDHSDNSGLLGDTSVESRQSVTSRAPSASRKASVNLSLLRNQRDLRLPAHMIVDAYREALREKAEAAQQKRAAPSPPPASQTKERPHKVAKVERSTISDSQKASSSFTQSSGRKQKPIKHKIQLVTKPVLDLSALPEDRKKRPGFISANFDVSDDDSEPEPEPTGQKQSEGTLLRRPQIASDKLQRALAETPEADPKPQLTKEPQSSNPAPSSGFSFGDAKKPEKNGLSSLGDVRNGSPIDTPEAPKYSFGPTTQDASASSNVPKFSFGSKDPPSTGAPIFGAPKPAAESEAAPKPLNFGNSSNKPAGPSFSFGAKKDEKSGENDPQSTDKKPNNAPVQFSFLPKNGDANPNDKTAPSAGSNGNKPADKPAFTFNASGNKFSFGGANKSTDGDAAAASSESTSKPIFSFGAPATDSGKPAEKPAESSTFKFGSTDKPAQTPAFSFGSTDKPSQTPALTFGSTDKPTQTPAFNFSKTDNPVQFGGESSGSNGQQQGSNDNTVPKPSTPVFGTSSAGEKPMDKLPFSFGATNTGDAKPASQPFQFGADAKGDQPGHKPTFSLGQSSNNFFGNDKSGSEINGKPEEKPKLAFGSSATNGQPAFSFNAGSTNNTAPGSQNPPSGNPALKPGFGGALAGQPLPGGSNTTASPAPFGTNVTTGTPGFSFGAKQDSASPGGAVAQPPPISFGGSSTGFGAAAPGQQPSAQPAQQSFTFGSQPAAGSQPQQQPAFQFGSFAQPSNSRSSTPFGFGAPAPTAPTAPTNGDSPASSFQFGMPQGATAGAGPSQFGSRESTPGAGSTQQRKIAQVKRRLRR